MFVKGGQGTKHYCHHTLLLIRVEIYPVLRLFILKVWKAILTGPLALLSVALSTADNPFPATKMSGEKCFSWTKTIDLELVKVIKARTGGNTYTIQYISFLTLR